MKYIRLKDRIVDSNETIRTSSIVKQADTIEELCDEFVAERKSDKEKLHLYHHNWKELVEMCWKEETEINLYGAIWTDKGLIYVAKMNEKGELELL